MVGITQSFLILMDYDSQQEKHEEFRTTTIRHYVFYSNFHSLISFANV